MSGEIMSDKKRKIILIVLSSLLVIMIGIIAFLLINNHMLVSQYTANISQAEKYLQTKDYEDALVAYKQALELDPDSEDPYLGLANTYVAMGDKKNAVSILNKGLDRMDSSKLRTLLKQLEGYKAESQNLLATDSAEIEFNKSFEQKIVNYTYEDFKEEFGSVESAVMDSDGYLEVVHKDLKAICYYKNTSDNKKIVNTSKKLPYKAAMPEKIQLESLKLLFNNWEGYVSLDNLEILVGQQLKPKKEDGKYVVEFEAGDYTMKVETNQDGKITSENAWNELRLENANFDGQKTQDKQHQTSTTTSATPDNLPSSSKKLAKIINKEYIGDQLYYYEENPSVKIGCIEIIALDLDNDDQEEIISIENDASNFRSSPILKIYEYSNNNWEISAEQQITITANSEENPDIACSCELYLYVIDNQIAVRITESSSYSNLTEFYTYSNDGAINVSEDAEITEYNMHEKGKIFSEIYYQYMSKDIYTHWGGQKTAKNDSYIVNFVNWKNPQKYETEEYAFSYPKYYDDYLDIKTEGTDTIGYSKLISNRETVWEFNGKPYSLFSFSKGDTNLELYEDHGSGFPQLNRSVLLWQNGEEYIAFDQGGDSIACIAYLTAQNNYDIKDFNIYWMILYDMKELRYHFETSLAGTVTIERNE